MPNEKHSVTCKPTAAMSTTFSKAQGPIEAESGPIDPLSTPRREDVGNPAQQASAPNVGSTATPSEDNRQTNLIDEAITNALDHASTAAMSLKKTSKSANSKGGAGGGPSRKRDHDTMTSATQPPNASGGGSAIEKLSVNHPRDGDELLATTKFRRILPKLPGAAQPGFGLQGPLHEGLIYPGQSQSQSDPTVSGDNAANGDFQTIEEARNALPFLSGHIFLWLPPELRTAASNGRSFLYSLITQNDTFLRKQPDAEELQYGLTNIDSITEAWHTTLRALADVAIATRDGRQLTNRPILRNVFTDFLDLRIPDPDQLCRLRGDNQSIPAPPNLSADIQQGENPSPSPISMGNNPAHFGSNPVGEASEEIDTLMRISSRNEIARQTQNAQLHSLLMNQSQAHAQGLQDLQSAHRKADEARDQESELIVNLIKKRSELLNKKDG